MKKSLPAEPAKKIPTYNKSPRPAHAVTPAEPVKPKRTKPDANFAQSKDLREDRGIRQIKTDPARVPVGRSKP
jgi:hypothetical protein